MTRPFFVVLLVVVVAGCSSRRAGGVGLDCELASECAAPLVCRLGHCRNECRIGSDCAPGLSCVLDQNALGSCQLALERQCRLPSDCPVPLVCRGEQCVNECVEDRDCLGGARCARFPEGGACIEPDGAACVADAECHAIDQGTFCIAGRCRPQCYTDRDCRNDWRCDGITHVCSPRRDAGGLDANAPVADAGADAVAIDGGGRCTGGPLGPVVDWDLGADYGCAILEDGTRQLWCWGGIASGARGTLVESLCADEVAALRGADLRDVVTGDSSTCVLLGSGEVQCFGDNFYGQLGRGATLPRSDVVPVAVAGLIATELYGGSESLRFFARVAGSGTLVGWGENAYGALDDGSTMNRFGVVSVGSFTNATFMGSGGVACAVVAGGDVLCRGYPFDGALGRFGPAISGATDVAVGERFSCALEPGGVWCWGQNVIGQLGDGTTTSREMRARVIGLPTGVIDLVAGQQHACVLTSAGEVWCWGAADSFVPGGAGGTISTPMLVTSAALSLRALGQGTCVERTAGIECVGRYGLALGIGMRESPADFTPVQR